MQLLSLRLNNFRNFSEKKLDFSDRNLIYGRNGSGKTNILEALHLVCTGKSFRANYNNNFIKKNKPSSSVFINYIDESNKTKNKQSLVFEPRDTNKVQKSLYRNSKKVSVSDFIGKVPVIVFASEELKMIWGSPKDRRSILDLFIAQTMPSYAIQLLKYLRVIRQRNRLLFVIGVGRAKIRELEFWDTELVSMGSDIINNRNNITKGLNKYIKDQYKDISGTSDVVSLSVESTVSTEIEGIKLEEVKSVYKNKLKQNIKSDVKQGYTSIGPHRDDIGIRINNNEISCFGSRGEGKTAVLAMKFSQRQLLRDRLGVKKCLFLLDDAFSELDKERGEYLLNNLSDEQSIFTYTSVHPKIKKFNLIKL